MKLSQADFTEIRQWMVRHARPLELSLWKFHLEQGSAQDVLNILSFYQNKDGGFGHALEPDCWNPHSSPYTTSFAIKILKNIGFLDRSHPIYTGIIRYLESGDSFENGQWLFSIPSNDAYPRAPWMTYNPDVNQTENTGLSAELAAFILEFCDKQSALYQTALQIARRTLDALLEAENHGAMGIGGYLILEPHLDALSLNEADKQTVLQKLRQLVRDSIEPNTEKWQFYVPRPSEFIHSPASPDYWGNEALVEKELDYLIQQRPQGDVWGIPWSWFEHSERYAKEFALSETWWKAYRAINIVMFLDTFGRLEEPQTEKR